MLKKWWLFIFFFSLLIYDKLASLISFGFVYTDIDQVLMWNGAIDYAKGDFYEPFFYGQAYNYMLEAFLAVPLLWGDIAVYKALPIITSILSLLPFIFLAILLIKKKQFFWAHLSLIFPLLLPLEYNLLTTIPRGFIQAHLFLPLLFVPLIYPKNKKNIVLLCLSAALCIIANQSTIFLIVPIFLYVWLHHYKEPSFYWKALLILPIFKLDYLAKYFYEINPERVVHVMEGLIINTDTFLKQLSNVKLFEHLFPFISSWGILYPLIFVCLAIWTKLKQKKHAFWFLVVVFLLLVVSLFVPKIHEIYPSGGLFFTSSRLYLTLPLVLFIGLYLSFKHLKIHVYINHILLLVALIFLSYKTINLNSTVNEVVKNTGFPVLENEKLINQINALAEVTKKHNIDVVINGSKSWKYHFENYAFYPLTQCEKPIFISHTNERRYWLYQKALESKRILLNGIQLDSTQKKRYEYLVIDNDYTLINGNKVVVSELLNSKVE